MDRQTTAIILLLVLLVVAVNGPFFSERLGLLGPMGRPKNLLWRLVELLVLGSSVVALGVFFEQQLGQVHAQDWPFYVAMLCLFLCLAFPGFVWRYLIKQ